MSASAVVLAAGESRRMGTPKMLLPWGSGTVLQAAVASLLRAPVDQVVVVLGHRAAEIAAGLGPLSIDPRVRVCINEHYPGGMLTSIQCGVRALGTGNLLVALGDQPLISPEAVAEILAAHEGGLTLPSFGGRRGHPVCIDESLREPLLALPPEAGLRGLFQAYPERAKSVAVTCGGVLIDLDTPADYDRYRPEMTGGDPHGVRRAAGS